MNNKLGFTLYAAVLVCMKSVFGLQLAANSPYRTISKLNVKADGDTDKAVGLNKSQYENAVRHSRRSVRIRDTDIVLASFPKSGTHFLAAAVSLILYRTNDILNKKLLKYRKSFDVGSRDLHLDESTGDSFRPINFFHEYPIFTLLPDGRGAAVPDEMYSFIESIPDTYPRIFLVR